MRNAMRLAMVGAATTCAALLPTNAEAQRMRGAMFPEARFTIEVFGGLANYGRFLEQYVVLLDLDDDGVITDDAVIAFGQREVTAKTALALGLSVGGFFWDKTGVRLGFTWSPSEIEYRDDTGTDVEIFDQDDVADLSAYVLSLDLMRFLFDPRRRFAPYVAAGITGTWWSLDDDDDEILSTDATHFRWGGTTSIGLQYRATRNIGVRAEVATMALGNPFDGNDSFRTDSGLTFDEPSTVRFTRITLALTYSFLKR